MTTEFHHILTGIFRNKEKWRTGKFSVDCNSAYYQLLSTVELPLNLVHTETDKPEALYNATVNKVSDDYIVYYYFDFVKLNNHEKSILQSLKMPGYLKGILSNRDVQELNKQGVTLGFKINKVEVYELVKDNDINKFFAGLLAARFDEHHQEVPYGKQKLINSLEVMRKKNLPSLWYIESIFAYKMSEHYDKLVSAGFEIQSIMKDNFEINTTMNYNEFQEVLTNIGFSIGIDPGQWKIVPNYNNETIDLGDED